MALGCLKWNIMMTFCLSKHCPPQRCIKGPVCRQYMEHYLSKNNLCLDFAYNLTLLLSCLMRAIRLLMKWTNSSAMSVVYSGETTHVSVCLVYCVFVWVCVCTFPDTFHSKQTNKAEIPWKKTKMNHEWIIKVSPWAFYWSHWRCCNIFQGFDNPVQFLLRYSRQWRHFKILWVSVFQTFLFLIHVCIKHYIWLDLTENRKLVSCVKTALWNMF